MKKIIIFIFIFVVYLIITFNPSLFMKNKCQCSSFVIHSFLKYECNNLCQIFDREAEKYKNYGDLNFDIYIYNGEMDYRLFSFFSKGHLNLNIFKGFINLPFFDIERKEFKNVENGYKEVINEAILRGLLFKKYSPFTYLFIDDWKIIGYAKIKADEIEEFELSSICEGNKTLKYKRYENMVVTRYIVDEKNYNVLNFFNDNISYDVYLKEVRNKYCK